MVRNFFTIMELLVVVAITSLILAIALPSIGKFPSGVLTRRTISDLEVGFNNARLMALASGSKVTISVNFERDEVTVSPTNKSAELNQLIQRAQNPEMEEFDGVEQTRSKNVLFNEIKLKLHNGVKIKPQEDFELESYDFSDPDQSKRYVFEFYPEGEAFGPVLDLNIGTAKYSLEVDRITGKPIIIQLDEN